MPRHLNSLAAVTLVAFSLLALACARSDASARDTSTHASAPAAAGSAGGALASSAPSAVPHDSLSEKADHGRIAGDSTASLWVIMASDFQCPYCKGWHDAAFTQLMNDYVKTGKIRLAFLNMPLSIHANAVPASEAAMCASIQNKFWPMHEALFATQASWEQLKDPKPKFDSIATSVGVEPKAYHNCIDKHLTLALIQADHDRARTAGVNSTPSFFVGGKTLTGSDADVRGAIEAALKGGKS
jgi:protein-disulfide isomerase